MRELHLLPGAIEDLGWWVMNDLKMLKRIYSLIENNCKTPFEGIGKPEPLKSNFAGYWSRRITDEHRLIYKVDSTKITIISLLGHYQR